LVEVIVGEGLRWFEWFEKNVRVWFRFEFGFIPLSQSDFLCPGELSGGYQVICPAKLEIRPGPEGAKTDSGQQRVRRVFSLRKRYAYSQIVFDRFCCLIDFVHRRRILTK
jgi:hypothetical protein